MFANVAWDVAEGLGYHYNCEEEKNYQIISGKLKADEALPSIRGLVAKIGVSVITTKRAYEELEKEGLIRSVANKGFYVCEYNTDYLHEKQLIELEKRFQECIQMARQVNLKDDDIREMLEGLL